MAGLKWFRQKWQIFLIILFALLSYSNAFSGSFVFDDAQTITRNFFIRNPQYFTAIFTFHRARILGILSFLLNYQFFSLNTFWYHAINIGIHLICALLVYYFISLLQKSNVIKRSALLLHKFLPLAVALFFITHPIQTQAVAYISQRFTSLAALFYLSGLVFYLKSKLDRSTSGFNFLLSIFFAILAMLTKENAFSFPLIILVLEFSFFPNKSGILKSFLPVLPYFLISLFIFLIIYVLPANARSPIVSTQSLLPKSNISRQVYSLTQINVLQSYLSLLIWPANQNADYDYPLTTSFDSSNWFPELIIIFLLIFAFITYRKFRLISFGIIFFFIALLPESSIFPIDDVINEHRLYLPSVGFFIALSSIIFIVFNIFYNLAGRLNRNWQFITARGFAFILVTILLTLSFTTYRRNKVWQSEYSLWRDTVEKSPNKARVRYNLGVALADLGKFDLAKEQFEKAVNLESKYINAYHNLGAIYEMEGNPKLALKMYLEAQKLDNDSISIKNSINSLKQKYPDMIK